MARTRKAAPVPAKAEPTVTVSEPQTSVPGGTYGEIGVTGLKHWSGYIDEEFHRELRGDKGLKVYEEMQANDATVGAVLYAVEMALRNVAKSIEAPGESAEEQQATELVETALDDMSQSWPDTKAEFLTMLGYGFSYHEIVYKQRKGYTNDPTTRSQHDDGLFGWRKMPIRAQLTRLRWEMDDAGGVKGMWQLAPPKYEQSFIPIGKALLFRPRLAKNNPEGRSVLRTAYRPWYFKRRVEEIEGIGIERDLAGLPVIECPARITLSGATGAEQATYAALKKMVANIRRDEQAGVVLPQHYDEHGNPMYKLSLLSTGGQRQVDTNAVITRFKQDIATSILADVILMGQDKVGSFALAGTKKTLFSVALDSWNEQIADIFNRHAIPRLLGLNGYKLKKLPKLIFDDVETVDWADMAQLITSLAGAGMPLFPDFDLEDHLREKLKLPRPTEEEYDLREQERMEQEAERMMQEAAVAEQGKANAEREKAGEKAPVEKAQPPIVVHTQSQAIPSVIDLRFDGERSDQPVYIERNAKGTQTKVKRGNKVFLIKRNEKGHVTTIAPEEQVA